MVRTLYALQLERAFDQDLEDVRRDACPGWIEPTAALDLFSAS
jgi:hypothetical protein